MPSDNRSIDDLLGALADTLFPGDDEPRRITLESTDCNGDTPLHVYLWRSDDWAARLLTELGANVNAIGDMGETPLHVAVRSAEARTLAALLTAGARTDVVSEFGQTPLQLAETLGREAILREALSLARDAKEVWRREQD